MVENVAFQLDSRDYGRLETLLDQIETASNALLLKDRTVALVNHREIGKQMGLVIEAAAMEAADIVKRAELVRL